MEFQEHCNVYINKQPWVVMQQLFLYFFTTVLFQTGLQTGIKNVNGTIKLFPQTRMAKEGLSELLKQLVLLTCPVLVIWYVQAGV